ncbi:ATP-binding cassette domain-containing protein, partial [Streptosporangium algeriense]
MRLIHPVASDEADLARLYAYPRERCVRLNMVASADGAAWLDGLSGGQRAQVAVTMALAGRPDLLVLDEPLANLDPLARHDVMRSILAETAERELTVLLSSHVVSDLEETCDWLIVLNGGRLQVSGDIEELLGEHLVLTGPREASAAGTTVVGAGRTGRQVSMLVRGPCPPD